MPTTIQVLSLVVLCFLWWFWLFPDNFLRSVSILLSIQKISVFYFVYMQISYSPKHPYVLYVLTVTGVAYLLKLGNISTYSSSSVFPPDELLEFNIQAFSNHGAITTVAATAGCLVVGFSDGSVSCFQLGILEQSAPGIIKLSRPTYVAVSHVSIFNAFHMDLLLKSFL